MLSDSDRDVLRTIIREELHAVLGELETARVRRSAALEELALNDAAGSGWIAADALQPGDLVFAPAVNWLAPISRG